MLWRHPVFVIKCTGSCITRFIYINLYTLCQLSPSYSVDSAFRSLNSLNICQIICSTAAAPNCDAAAQGAAASHRSDYI